MNKRNAQEMSDKVIIALKKERIRQGISRYKLAKDIDMSQSSMMNIEKLTQKPTFYTLWMIANYLNVRLGDIINNIDE